MTSLNVYHMAKNGEIAACRPHPIDPGAFNREANLPYGLTTAHIMQAMNDFLDFLGFINQQLNSRQIPRLESFIMPANFSSIVGEFIKLNIPRYCHTLVNNRYHNGHPDLIPSGRFEGDAVQHSNEGIEIKASRYLKGWQGHNPEEIWLMIFVFDSDRPVDRQQGVTPKPFRFLRVLGAKLTVDDWTFAGRSPTSRRTITASVNDSGYQKMMANIIYAEQSL
jgi:hypothetical protein